MLKKLLSKLSHLRDHKVTANCFVSGVIFVTQNGPRAAPWEQKLLIGQFFSLSSEKKENS